MWKVGVAFCYALFLWQCSRDNFTAIVELPEGRHQYKFYVNGEWIHDPGEVRGRGGNNRKEVLVS